MKQRLTPAHGLAVMAIDQLAEGNWRQIAWAATGQFRPVQIQYPRSAQPITEVERVMAHILVVGDRDRVATWRVFDVAPT